MLQTLRTIQGELSAMNTTRKKKIDRLIEVTRPPVALQYAGLGEKNLNRLPLPLKPEVEIFFPNPIFHFTNSFLLRSVLNVQFQRMVMSLKVRCNLSVLVLKLLKRFQKKLEVMKAN
jgi:hypothetical protein